MRPFVAVTFVLGCVSGAPSTILNAGLPLAGGVYAGNLGYANLGFGAANLGYAAAPVAANLAYAAAPVAVDAAHVYAAAPAVVPAPYTTQTQAAGVTTVHQPEPVVTKTLQYGQTSYVSGHATRIIKPPTPHLPIQVSTALKGSVSYNAPIVKTQEEIHTFNVPNPVERRVEVPYDVPVYKENIVRVDQPYPVDRPYEVRVPVAVQGETIVKNTYAQAIHTASHENVHVANPAVHVAAGHAAYAAAPIAAAHY